MTVSYHDYGAGPAIIFLHGVGSGKEGWRNQIDPILSIGWRFIAIDAPGFGTTPLPQAPGFQPHIQCVIETMDQLNISDAVLCGHSLGGMTVQEIAAAHAKRVNAIVLSATSPAFGRPDGGFQKQFLKQRFEPFDSGMTMPEYAQKFSKNLVDPAADQSAVSEIIDVMSPVSIEAYRMSMHTITAFDQRANLPNIEVPTLLIGGESDQNAPSNMMQKMAGKIPGANFIELKKTGHMAPVENPAKFNQVLLDFLKRTSNQ